MAKKICIPLIILLCLFLSVLIWNDHKESERMNQINEQINKELSPLRVELDYLKQELDKAENSYKKQVNGSATINFLFTNVRDKVYSEAWSKLQEYGFCGMIVLSDGDLPGMENNMSVEQFQELLAAGWDWCIGWPAGSIQPEETYQRIMQWARGVGLEQTASVYFPEETYSEEYDEWLVQHGCSIAIHHGETGKSLVITKSEEGIWHPGATDWMGNNRRTELDKAVSACGNIVYAITLGREDANHNENYEMEYMDSMLTKVDTYCQADSARVVTVEEARQYRQQVEESKTILESEWNVKKEMIEEQMDELNKQMDDIQDKYLNDY